jgi:exopolysaccharide biosynthesis predicted pyruvyltransferase EpsI
VFHSNLRGSLLIKAEDARNLSLIRDQTRAILNEVVGSNTTVALLDFPSHQNVGDTMILMGETTYLAQGGNVIGYVTDISRYDQATLRRRVPNGPILMQGGGNFGDIWPLFQSFRERIVQEFPDKKIVQLPQTVYFKSAAAAARANGVLGRHNDYTLMVRDTPSLERARLQLPDVRAIYCPDLALGWEPEIPRGRLRQNRMVVLARKDREASSGLLDNLRSTIGPHDKVVDWGLTGGARIIWDVVRIPARFAKLYPRARSSRLLYPLFVFSYEKNAELNISGGIRELAGAELVVTDRLHAHILAGLLGIRHLVLDNNYGKVSSIYNDYTHLFSTAEFVADAASVNDHIKNALNKDMKD